MTVLDIDSDVTLSGVDARHHLAVRTALRGVPASTEWEDVDVAEPPRDDAAARGVVDIDRLAYQRLITPTLVSRGKSLTTYLFKTSTVYATISPDDEGLSFYWAAQEMSITIIVYGDGYWWSVHNDNACDTYMGASVDLPLIRLQHSLNLFSKEVARRNPQWRSLIR